MGMSCKCCQSKNRLEIDRAIVSGQSKSSIARDWGVSEASVAYHEKHGHVTRQMAKAGEVKAQKEAVNVFTELEDLMSRTKKILVNAEKKNHNGIALSAIRELRGNIALISSIQLAITQQQQNNEKNPDWYERQKQEEEITKELFQEIIPKLLQPEEFEVYGDLNLKIIAEDYNMRIDRIKYGDVKEETAHKPMQRTKLYKDTTEEVKAQETASLEPDTEDIEDKEEPMGVKEIVPTEIPYQKRFYGNTGSGRRNTH